MSKKLCSLFAGLCALTTLTLVAFSAGARAQEVKPKPPMFSYIANWQVPRANWPDMDKAYERASEVMSKAQDDGTLVGYGRDINLVHTVDGETHDLWWSATSMANIVKVLDQVRASSDTNSSALNLGKHWDEIYVSRYYNWKSGSFKGAYTHVGFYKFKADAPDDALESLAQQMIVPLLEKLFADGTILEYEIDTQAIHTSAPGTFAIVYVCPSPEGLDTVQAAVRDSIKAHPLNGQAFGSMIEDSGHRDELLKTDGSYK